MTETAAHKLDRHLLQRFFYTDLAEWSGAEHEQQYFHGGCPECGCFYNHEFDWQHFYGCSRATKEQPAQEKPRW